MVAIEVRRRTGTDEQVIALLRRFAANALSESELATALFELAEDVDGEIGADALHIAAEATSDNDLSLARELWLELLGSIEGNAVTSSAGVTAEPSHLRFPERSRNVTAQVRVPA